MIRNDSKGTKDKLVKENKNERELDKTLCRVKI